MDKKENPVNLSNNWYTKKKQNNKISNSGISLNSSIVIAPYQESSPDVCI